MTMLRGNMRSAAPRPAPRASRIRVRTSGSTVRRFPNASRYSASRPQRAARSNTRSMVEALYDRPDLTCGAKDLVWIDGAATTAIRVCSLRTPSIAHAISCFSGQRDLSRGLEPKGAAPGSMNAPPPPGRVDRAAKPIRAVTANPSIRSVSDLSKHRIYIEDVYPVVDVGRFPVKRIVGEELDVWADIFRDGHVVLAAELLWRREGADKWLRVPMVLHDNDRWKASFTPPKVGRYVYAIEAWTDVFASWRRDFLTKRAAGIDVGLEIEEGRNLLADLQLKNSEQARLIRDVCRKPDIAENPAPLLSQELAAAASKGQQSDLTRSATYPLVADRPIARAGAWYEMVPRSQSLVPGKHGTFDDCINRLPDIAAMGFDVLYLTPIHPIGRVNRKGRNNSLRCQAGDPGSPYAIGSAEGAHDAVHPELGTLNDFRRLVRACAEHGLEVALDFAVQCSPDHPWLAQHPQWFRRRPDGSIQYSENPPKKYEDIVNPDVIFLSEAFTRPKVMKALAKLGFSQSYTYFTWRTGKEELQAYLSEITG